MTLGGQMLGPRFNGVFSPWDAAESGKGYAKKGGVAHSPISVITTRPNVPTDVIIPAR